ncbi:MAG: hypothetical protein GQE15_32970 [Archangiaceae bacterium]|nr:hypothetical protein [Archangiaceae bacterium]
MLALALTLVLAAPKVSIGPPPPLIVMIRTDGPPAFVKTQARLHEELTLLLDSFIVLNTPIAIPDFPRKPLADQLAAVLPVAKSNDAAAVVWLSEPIPGQLMLHLVAQGTGRTLVRTLEFDKKSRNESALALMMRELLGTAFLYEAPATVPPQLRAVVKQTRATMSNAADVAPAPIVDTPIAPPAPARPPDPKRLRLMAFGLVDSGIVDHIGGATRYGGSLTAMWKFTERLGVGLDWGVTGHRAVPSPTTAVSSVSMPILAVATHSYAFGPFAIWPRGGLGPEVTWTVSRQSVPGELSTLTGAGLLGVDVSAGTQAFTFVFRLEALARLGRTQLTELPGDQILWRQPAVSLHAGIGLAWEGL